MPLSRITLCTLYIIYIYRKKRKKYEKFLESVPLLQTMSDYERSKIAEALRPQVTKTGGYIIKEGEEGIVFYMLEKGHAYASKVLESGQEPKKLMDYKKGDYFGELALLSGNRRAANIIAKVYIYIYIYIL